MKARIMGKTIEIPDERLMGGVDVTRKAGTIDDGRPHSKERTLIAGSIPAPSPLPGWPKPSDKWNAAYAQYLELEKQAGRVKYWWYEAFSLWLPGQVRYRPDFLIQYPDGLERKLHFVEIKGFSKNRRDGITRYKIAASLFPCFSWSMMKRAKGGWEEYS